MKRITAALGACFLWGSLLAPASPANEIFEVLAPPAAPADVDDASSPSDLPLGEPDSYIDEGDGGYAGSNCECGPAWTFTFGAIFLNRSNPSPALLVADGLPPDGTNVLDASQFNFGTNWGFEMSAIRHRAFGTAWDVEGRYFGVNQWSAGVNGLPTGEDGVVLYATPGLSAAMNSVFDATYVSQLNSFELNGRRAWNEWLQVLGGVRLVELDERGLSITQSFDGGAVQHQIGALNQLWGFQLGLDAQLLSHGRFTVTSFAKAGVYGNAASNSAVVDLGGQLVSSAASDHGVAFVGELGAVGLYRLTDRWSLRATYQMLWLDGVATASNQVGVSDPQNGTATVDRGGDVFYHGGFVGAQFNW